MNTVRVDRSSAFQFYTLPDSLTSKEVYKTRVLSKYFRNVFSIEKHRIPSLYVFPVDRHRVGLNRRYYAQATRFGGGGGCGRTAAVSVCVSWDVNNLYGPAAEITAFAVTNRQSGLHTAAAAAADGHLNAGRVPPATALQRIIAGYLYVCLLSFVRNKFDTAFGARCARTTLTSIRFSDTILNIVERQISWPTIRNISIKRLKNYRRRFRQKTFWVCTFNEWMFSMTQNGMAISWPIRVSSLLYIRFFYEFLGSTRPTDRIRVRFASG